MLLLEEIQTERGEIPRHLREKYNEAEAEFLKEVVLTSTGIDLLKDLYAEADRYLGEYLKTNEISCGKGCGHCCKQLICCTTLEMQLIVKYMSTKMIKTQRKDLKKRLKKAGTKFAMWFQNSLFDVPKSQASLISEPIRAKYFGKACPFLKNEICCIYPVRPIICRTTKVKGDSCGLQVPLGSKRTSQPIKLYYDQVVTELLKKEQKRLYGEIKIMPVNVWPLSKEFKHYFF